VKRSPELAGLSRDHHRALEVALRLRRATAADVDAAVARFLAFWREHGRRHFEVEEEVLFAALPPGDDQWATATRRIRTEHDQLRSHAEALETAPSAESARAVGVLLDAHVRYEERHAFPLLEQRLEPDELARLGRELDAASRH
jgi:hemerythrin-like domain-containing protein